MPIERNRSNFILKLIKRDALSQFIETICDDPLDDTLDIQIKFQDIVFSNPTMLNMCFWFNATKIANYILDTVNFNKTDSNNRNWLHYVACSCSIDGVKYFFSRTKDSLESFFKPDASGLTPAHYAAMFGNFDLIKKFKTEGIKISQILDKKNRSPFHLACMYGHFDIVKYYIEQEEGEEAQSLLKCAIKYGKDTILKQLIEEYQINTNVEINGIPSLCYAAKHGYISVVRMILDDLIKNEISKDELIKGSKFLPLIDACRQGHTDIISFLIKQGSDPNQCDQRDTSPLYAAVMSNDYSSIEELVKNGAMIPPDKLKESVDNIKYPGILDLYLCEKRINEFKDDNFKILSLLCKNNNIKAFNLIYKRDMILDIINNDMKFIEDKEKLLNKIYAHLKKRENRNTDILYFRSKDLQLESSCNITNSGQMKEKVKVKEEEENYEPLDGISQRDIIDYVIKNSEFNFEGNNQILKPNFCRMYVLLITAIQNNSQTIFKCLIENNFHPPDSTDLYIETLRANKMEFCKIMLENQLLLDENNKTLKNLVRPIKDEYLLKLFSRLGISIDEPQSSPLPFLDQQVECEFDNYPICQPLMA